MRHNKERRKGETEAKAVQLVPVHHQAYKDCPCLPPSTVASPAVLNVKSRECPSDSEAAVRIQAFSALDLSGMTRCIVPSDGPFGNVNSVAHAAMDGITAQDFLENPELKVYVEDALRLVLAARPERPLDIINDYLHSVLEQENVVGREFAYINATMRNRQGFVRAVHNIFVGPGHEEAVNRGTGRDSLAEGCGFEQMDVVHLFGLVCPDFPEEVVTRVARSLSEGSKYVYGGGRCPRSARIPQRETAPMISSPATASASPEPASATTSTVSGTDESSHSFNSSRSTRCAASSSLAAAASAEQGDFVKSLPFEEFFQDVRTLFSSMAYRVDGGERYGGGDTGDGGNDRVAVASREVNLRILLDQLQVMKAEPRNQLRYFDIESTEAAVRKGGLGERATLSAFLACLLLHSDEVASSLLEKPTVDAYAARLEACPALWSHCSGGGDISGRVRPEMSSGDGTNVVVETTGRRRKGSRRGSGSGAGR